MKPVDRKAVYKCIQGMFRDPTSYSKSILEDADWQEGGISWHDESQVKDLREEIEHVLKVIFKSANRSLDEILKS